MGTDDIKNAGQDAAGNIKEGVGKVTGDQSLENEGKIDQVQAAAKEAAEDVKDAAEKGVDAIKGIFDKD